MGAKLDHVLKQKTPHSPLFDQFYKPIEKALVEQVLEFFKGNQLKTANALGINRNTLKKKMDSYKINLKELLNGFSYPSFLKEEVFATSFASLPLFELSRHKIKDLKTKKAFVGTNLLERICRPVEVKIIQTCLEFFKGNQLKTANALGINRNTLKKKLDEIRASQ